MCNTTEKNHSVHTTSSPPCLKILNTTLPIAPVELHTTTTLPPAAKEYLCFQINGRYYYSTQSVKSWIIDNSVYYILCIEKSEQQCVVIKGMLHSPRLEDHMKKIVIDK